MFPTRCAQQHRDTGARRDLRSSKEVGGALYKLMREVNSAKRRAPMPAAQARELCPASLRSSVKSRTPFASASQYGRLKQGRHLSLSPRPKASWYSLHCRQGGRSRSIERTRTEDGAPIGRSRSARNRAVSRRTAADDSSIEGAWRVRWPSAPIIARPMHSHPGSVGAETSRPPSGLALCGGYGGPTRDARANRSLARNVNNVAATCARCDGASASRLLVRRRSARSTRAPLHVVATDIQREAKSFMPDFRSREPPMSNLPSRPA
jgi:hypothetical protein